MTCLVGRYDPDSVRGLLAPPARAFGYEVREYSRILSPDHRLKW